MNSFTIGKYALIVYPRLIWGLLSQVDVPLDKDIYVPPIITATGANQFWRMRSYMFINIDLGQEVPVFIMHTVSGFLFW